MAVSTELGNLGIYNKVLSSINSHSPLIMLSCKVTWNFRSVISPLQQCLWLPDLARWWLTMRSFHPQSFTTLWTRSHVRPRDKLKTSSLPQCLWPPNLAECYIHRGASLHINRSLVTNWKRFISSIALSDSTKVNHVAT